MARGRGENQLLHFYFRLGQRRVDHDSDVGGAEHLQVDLLELQQPKRWMLHDFMQVQRAQRVVMRPPEAKFRADPFQVLDQFLKRAIARIASAGA